MPIARAFLLGTLALAAALPQPAELTLSTIPFRVFKEDDAVIGAGDTETFVVWIVLKGKGPPPEPLRAEVSSSPALNWLAPRRSHASFWSAYLRSVSFTRLFVDEPELFDLRHHFLCRGPPM